MPRIVDHDERRKDLLEASFEVFDQEGYGAVSMRGLAKGLGVSTGTLYHYFDGKEAIFEALARHRFASDLTAFESQVPADATAELRIVVLAEWLRDNVDHLQATLRLMLDYRRQVEVPGAFMAEVLDGYRNTLATALGPDAAAPALSLVMGLLTQRLLDPGSVDVDLHLGLLATLRG